MAELKKNSLFIYLEIYKNKFFNILILNAIFFTAFSLLTFLILALSYLAFGTLNLNPYLLPVVGLPYILLGPIIAAITKICRDYVREVPGFFLEEFKSAIKMNWKQSTLVAMLQYIVIWIFSYSIPFYYNNLENGSFMNTFGLGICLLSLLVFVFMSYFIYMMVVTLKLKLMQIIKNSIIFSFLCLFKNIILSVILGIWLFISVSLVYLALGSGNGFVYGIVISFFMTLFFGFIFYTVSFFSFNPIKKHILDPYYEKHPEQTSAALQNVNTDEISLNQNEKQSSEFVYHNGKMVHRTALEQNKIFDDDKGE